MKVIKVIITTAIVLSSITSWSKETQLRFSINIPTIEQEATSIWRTINDIEFFEKQGYTVNLPKDKLIDSLIEGFE